MLGIFEGSIAAPLGGEAVLLVARLQGEGLPSAPPASPQSATGGRAIAYWQSGSMVYVLVVPGNARNYRSYVRSAPSTVA